MSASDEQAPTRQDQAEEIAPRGQSNVPGSADYADTLSQARDYVVQAIRLTSSVINNQHWLSIGPSRGLSDAEMTLRKGIDQLNAALRAPTAPAPLPPKPYSP